MELAWLHLLGQQLTGPPEGPGSSSAGGHGQPSFVSPKGRLKAVYFAPLRALVQERMADWQGRFGRVLGLNCLEMSGDAEPDAAEMMAADLICTTPEKFGECTKATPCRMVAISSQETANHIHTQQNPSANAAFGSAESVRAVETLCFSMARLYFFVHADQMTRRSKEAGGVNFFAEVRQFFQLLLCKQHH